MKLTDALKIAVETCDWSIICRVYYSLTGEIINPPPKSIVDMDVDIDMNMVCSGSYEPPSHITTPIVQEIKPPESSFIVGNQKKNKKGQIQGSEINLFVDDFSEHQNDLQSLNPSLKSLYGNKQHHKAERPGMVKVICSRCGKEEVVSRILAAGYNPKENTYKCDNCCLAGNVMRHDK